MENKHHIDSLIESLSESMSSESATPAGISLLTASPYASPLSKPESDNCHNYVAKLLFLCKRARPDMQTLHFRAQD